MGETPAVTRSDFGATIGTGVRGMDSRRRDASPELPLRPTCAGCGLALGDRYGWCGNCRAAYCFACGRAHFCTAGCPTNGCLAGLCVRAVEDRRLSERWGLPDDGPTGLVGQDRER
jgi:hypothetical protein